MRKISVGAAAGAAVLLSVALVSPAAAASTDEQSLVDVVAEAAPQDVDAAVEASLLSEEAGVLSVQGLSIGVSSDADSGISISTDTGVANIGLPFAASAGAGVSTAPGTVTYDNKNSTSSVVLVHDTGSVQVATVIEDPNAPTRYDYPIGVPEGAHLELQDGIVSVIDDVSTEVLGTFAAPWAKDASGQDVPTRYELNGNTLTQIVDHNSSVAYPVVADPVYTTSTIYLSHTTVVNMYNGMNNIDDICTIIPVSYWVGIACSGFPGAEAVEQAYWQNKRVKVTYHSCGFNYCSYNTFAAVP